MSNPYNNPGTCGIYKITSPSGKVYVGSSRNIEARWYRHKHDLKAGKHHSPPLQRSHDKYGVDGFSHEILEVCDVADLINKEQHYIDLLKPEYNVASDASTPIHTVEVRQRLSATMRAIWACPERRAAQSERVRKAGPSEAAREGLQQMWADPEKRAALLEKRADRKYAAFGKNWTLKELSVEYGVKYTMLKDRIRAGWDVERAVTETKRAGGL